MTEKTFEVGSFAELAHLVWEDVSANDPKLKHPLAPLIAAWQSGPLEVQAVRDTDGNLRADAIIPRVAMRRELNSGTDRLYLTPAYTGTDAEGALVALPGFENGNTTNRIPVLPVNLYDLGVTAGEARGGSGAAPIPARMLVKLAAAPSTFARHGKRFVTYKITLRDLRDALYPPERLDGKSPQTPECRGGCGRASVKPLESLTKMHESRYSNPRPATAIFHHLLRINENFGRIDLDMPIHVVLDIPPEVEGGVQLPIRLDQWGAESAPAYRALIGLSFLWHEPGRTHAPKGGRWMRRTGLDPYDPITDEDAIALTFPSSRHSNRRLLVRRGWAALENLEEHGELHIEGRRILPPKNDES